MHCKSAMYDPYSGGFLRQRRGLVQMHSRLEVASRVAASVFISRMCTRCTLRTVVTPSQVIIKCEGRRQGLLSENSFPPTKKQLDKKWKINWSLVCLCLCGVPYKLAGQRYEPSIGMATCSYLAVRSMFPYAKFRDCSGDYRYTSQCRLVAIQLCDLCVLTRSSVIVVVIIDTLPSVYFFLLPTTFCKGQVWTVLIIWNWIWIVEMCVCSVEFSFEARYYYLLFYYYLF
jgi:hypothetical protein